MTSTFTLWRDDSGGNNDRIRANLHAFIDRLPASKSWAIEVKEHRKRRSNDQNAYLWGCVYPTILAAGDEQLRGWTAEDIHEFMLGEIFGWETLEGLGRKRLRPIKRSSKMTTTEFSEFVAQIQQRMAALGIYVPDPEPVIPDYARAVA